MVQTTLFQGRLVSLSFIRVDGVQKTSVHHLISNTYHPQAQIYTTLNDAKGNYYYIPNPSKSVLKVTLKSQTSKSDDGKRTTSRKYGTALLEDSSSQKTYQYAVLIPTTSYHTPLSDLTTAQETTGSEIYKFC